MSDHSRERFRQVDALFDAVLDQPTGEQDAFLVREAGDDTGLRTEVQQLLAAHRASGDFLERAAQPDAAPVLRGAWDASPPAAPVHVGPFRIVREIGRGGMGAVFLAERDDAQFEQRVALKIVRGLGADELLVRRFRAERRILARLEHRHIARLLDGGVTEDGTPWFAMEFVEGERLDRWCDARALNVDARLALFEDACEAVQYAHRQLVVHRDLKPSNIMVTAGGELKLLDFGIAKLLGADDAEATQTGLAMTPQYAAPEQVRGEPVSTATDVYALGVLLYELLTGTRPYDVSQRTPAEVERIVSQQEPPRPSTTLESADRSERARARGSLPDRLQRRLRGDLDAIVMKALRKEPSRRYQSATELLDDLRREREGRPVLARPENAAYRLRRFAGRHRAAIAAATAFAALLVGGFLRERSLRRVAEAETRKSQAVQDYMVSVFDVLDPFAARPTSGEEVTARALLERGATRVDQELADQPDVQSEMRVALGRIYSNLGLFDRAEEQTRRALQQLRAQHGPSHPDVAQAMSQLGLALLRRGQFEEADSLLRQALSQQRRLLGNEASVTVLTLDYLATLEQERGRLPQADTLFREVLSARRHLAKTEADSADLAVALNNLGLLLSVRGLYEDAEPIDREALALSTRVRGASHPLTAQLTQNLAQVRQLRGDLDEAETLYRQALDAKRKALGDLHPSVTISMNNLGGFLIRERGKPEEADSLFRMAIALDRKLFGDRHGFVAAGLNNLASAARLRGRFDEAIRLSREAVAIAKEVNPAANRETAAYLSGLAASLLGTGDLTGAASAFRESLEQYREALGEGHVFTQTLAVSLGRVQRERGELGEAERLFNGALAALDSTRTSNRVMRIAAQVGLGQVMTKRGQATGAIPLLERAVAASVEVSGENHLRTAEARVALGQALLSAGQAARAEPILRLAVEKIEPSAVSQPGLLATARRALDEARRAPGK
jgi:serine/threonine-protein kinase